MEVKNSIGNGKAKELICTIHGHELRGGNSVWRGVAGQRGIKGRKKWDNYNTIINKVYFRKTKQKKHCMQYQHKFNSYNHISIAL